ncbi:OmpA family protein [Geomesophilobacter sediminis]|uniref:OmpA family protein n=1 Tax=Geomesophilobacter sediminis TaxID=2798584 RepID=A0A8J7LVN8_9BACT|nr:OmpA family protein [Geomesophilobacter sediminis]MBJ6725230.1 OmpA family protein [Geomesophilobacter sediminis]
MRVTKKMGAVPYLLVAGFLGGLTGCANYEVNTKRGDIPGYYIRSEMQESDRALEAARQAGKDTACPVEYKEAEAARDHAYDVFRACHTEEGAALAKQATAKANALCPPQAAAAQPKGAAAQPVAAAAQPKAAVVPIPVTEPTRETMKYCVSLAIEFDIGRDDIRPQYNDEVAKVGTFMSKYPSTTAVIEGYADAVGSDESNRQLSQRRAESVVKALENGYGIAPSRLSAKGYGKEGAIADNASDAGRQKNRRINAIIDCALDVKELAPPPERLCMTLKVEFATDSAEIDPRYFKEIDNVGAYMKKYPTTTAVIEGHTDDRGESGYNLRLSQQRAESVVQYLTKTSGIESSRLSAKGFGSTRRIAYNDTPEGRQANRRINAIIDCVIKQ